MRKVSIIIPVWNRAPYIKSIIDFLSEQTYRNFEVLFVVDSKTAEDTIDEIKQHSSKLDDVVTIVQDYGEILGEGRNVGLEKATGDIIWFLDADDRPLPDFLLDLVGIMEREDADIVIANYIRSSTLYPKIPIRKEYGLKTMNREEAIMARLKEKIPVTSWSKIITRDLIDKAELRFNHKYSEDVEHTYHAISNAKKICYYEKPLYVYYQHKHSMYGNSEIKDIRGTAEVDAYDCLEEYFKDDQLINKFKAGSSIIRMRSAVHMSKEGFMKFAKSEECKDMINRNLRDPISPEGVFFKLFPSLYYSIIHIILNLFFYRNGKCYTNCKEKG